MSWRAGDLRYITGVWTILRRARPPLLYFLRRGADAMSCETRLNPNGPGFQLVITEGAQERIEDFDDLSKLLERERDLLTTWRAQGWRDVGAPKPTPPDTWTGPG